MPDFKTLEPTNSPAFQIAWESTLKCNLDCSYCGDGHNNKIPHPSLDDSLETIDFIIDYVDVVMQRKPQHLKIANLNIQGGESLVHPNILEILQYATKRVDSLLWHLSIATITNAVIKDKIWKNLVTYIDNFTISFHTESTFAQQEQIRKNILYLVQEQKNFHVSVLMHPKHWDTCLEMIKWCEQNNIPHIKRQIDHHWLDMRFNYSKEQAAYLGAPKPKLKDIAAAVLTNGLDISSQGRSCCSNQELCTNKCNITTRIEGNNFKGWKCSVHEFFLYIRQTTGEVFTNKDCRMKFDNTVGPIGFLNNKDAILKDLKESNNFIICKKKQCWCGLCAPKAKTTNDYNEIMKKYNV